MSADLEDWDWFLDAPLEHSGIDRVWRDLQTDRVLGERASFEHRGFRAADLISCGAWRTTREIGVGHRARRADPVALLCRDPGTAKLEDWALRHLAGLAETRRRLRATSGAWRLTVLDRARRDAHGRWDNDAIPDAIWRAPWGTVAVEYDAGSHRLETVEHKATRYAAEFDAQVWTAATPERVSSLRFALGRALPERWTWRVLRVEWW